MQVYLANRKFPFNQTFKEVSPTKILSYVGRQIIFYVTRFYFCQQIRICHNLKLKLHLIILHYSKENEKINSEMQCNLIRTITSRIKTHNTVRTYSVIIKQQLLQ